MAYRNIVFLQEPYDNPAAEWLDNAWQGNDDSLVDYLKEYDQDGCGEITEAPPWGTGDDTFEHGGYIVSYNRNIPHVGLCEKIPS